MKASRGTSRTETDLVLMYFATLSPASGELTALQMTPLQSRSLKLQRPSEDDARWIREVLERISAPYGTHVDLLSSGMLALRLVSSS